MKKSSKYSKKIKLDADLTFDEAMQNIIAAPKKEVEAKVKEAAKKPKK